ncbi:MAG TPA: YHYH protein [bacterium]
MLTALSRDARALLMALALATVFAVGACSSSGGGGGSSSSSSTSVNAPNCANGTTSADIDDDVPDWIKNNFTCISASVSGSNVVINTHSLPPYTSAYWDQTGTYASQYDASMPTNHTTNPNLIDSSDISMTIPMTPLTSSGDLSPTFSEDSASFGGIAVDGVAIFNAFAASPDLLSNEAWTLDENAGHPTNSGQYHYHVEPTQISDADDKLIGVALDGLPIYGELDQTGTGYVGAGTTAFNSSSSTATNWHCHATTEFPSGVCHYHVLKGYSENTTKAIGPVSSGTSTSLRYMIKYIANTDGKGTYQLAGATATMLKQMRVANRLKSALNCGPIATVVGR